jgi:predicted Zn-dependent protease
MAHTGTMWKKIIILAALTLWLAACASAPYTGRSQLMLIDQGQELALGASAYDKVLQQEKVSRDPALQALVERVGRRVAQAAERPDYDWRFTVVEDDSANAFALPGGKVAVYTGIFKYTQNEAGLATVMAHEVAHALARHGAERMSRGILLELGEAGLLAAVGSQSRGATEAVSLAYGLGTTVGVELPFSRSQELEADHIGLILMAKAGYDPREAVGFWERMSAKGGKRPPEFLSTHPYDEVRIRQLEQLLPEALEYYHPPRS